MKLISIPPRLLIVLLALTLCASFAAGATRAAKRSTRVPARSTVQKARNAQVQKARNSQKVAKVKLVAGKGKKRISSRAASFRTRGRARSRGRARFMNASATGFVAGGPWREPTFADSTSGDNVDGEDLQVRRAAVEALGAFNGSVVVTDPQTGRILTIVNQRVAFGNGFQPCSTIKVVAALAGLSEGVISRDSQVQLYGRLRMDLTEALARSNNLYFANIGVKLGYDKIAWYSKMYGLGERAGLDIEGENAGFLPDAPPKNGGMGMMMSFGEGIKLTPLQLAALLSAIANGGTLNYLQYPRSQYEVDHFVPRVKRHLAIQQAIPELIPGLHGATSFGTARRANYDPNEPVFGKTGTCTDRATPTHLGWFGSFNEINGRKLAVVVLLTGGSHVSGPVASGIAGQIYRALSQQQAQPPLLVGQPESPIAMIMPPSPVW